MKRYLILKVTRKRNAFCVTYQSEYIGKGNNAVWAGNCDITDFAEKYGYKCRGNAEKNCWYINPNINDDECSESMCEVIGFEC